MNSAIKFSNVTFLIYLLGTLNFCYGQEKFKLDKHSRQKQKINTTKQLQIIKTQGVNSGNIDCMLQDKNGNIWFGTGGEGVYRFDGKGFTNFTKKDGLSANYINAMVEDSEGNILFGTVRGICVYNGKTFTTLTASSDVSKNAITSILVDKKRNIWFGTWDNGVYRYDGKSFKNFLNKDDYKFNLGVHNQLIMDIFQDKNENIWFSSWNGGGVWQYNGKTFKNYLPSSNYYKTKADERTMNNAAQEFISDLEHKKEYAKTSENITDDMIFSISEDNLGNIWFATRRHGACKFDGKIFTSFRENEGFVSYGISSILQDKKGTIWLGTDKNGLYSFDGKTFKNFTEKDGLTYISIRSALADKSGNIWLGTRGFGLSRYDGKKFTTFSEVQK